MTGKWVTRGSAGIFAASNFNVDGGLPGAPSNAGSPGGIWNNVGNWNTNVHVTRPLASPVSFAEDREIFLSVRLRNQGDTMMGIGLASGTDASAGFVGAGFSWDNASSIGGVAGNASNAAYISHGTLGAAGGPYGIRVHETAGSVNGYGLLVARLILSATGSDRIDIVRYASSTIMADDPAAVAWTAGSSFNSSMNATHLLLWMNGSGGGEIDAIRIGTTWDDVTLDPSLRDLIGPSGPNGPFMHDGSLTGLGQITNHYHSAIPDNPNLDPRLRRPALTFNNGQLAPLRAFLLTLSGNAVYQDPKWSRPFTAAGGLELIVLPPSAFRLERDPAALPGPLVLRGQVAPELDYRIEASATLGGADPWKTLATVRADETGIVEHPVTTASERMFFRLVFDIPAS